MLFSEANGFVGIDFISIGAVLMSVCGLLVCGHCSFIDNQHCRTTRHQLSRAVNLREDAEQRIGFT